jgi:hypothetical protein
VARMGGNWYCRANGESMFELAKPLTTCGIGVDVLPEHIRLSEFLTGNDLGKLGNIEEIPSEEWMHEIKSMYKDTDVNTKAKELLHSGQSKEALALLW